MADPPGAPQLGALKQAEIECDNLIQTLAGDFENEIGALLDTVANPLSSSRFQQSYLAKFNEKIQAFGYSSVQYPEETIRKYERNLIKLIHLRFLDNATRKEAAPLIQKGLDDPSSYLWDKIRENRNDVKMTVGNYFYNFVAPTLVRQPDLIVEIRNISEDQVNEVFKEIVTNFADDLFLSTNFDSQFDKVTWFDRLSFGLFANVKDKYAKACKYVMDLVANISNYQMDPNRPVVLFDKTQIDAMTRSLKAHADARKRRALDKRTEKRLTALNVVVGISVGALIIIGAVVAINLPLAIGAAFLSALTCLAFNIEIFTQVIIRWYSKNRKAIKRTTMDLFSGLSNMLSSSGAPKSLTFP